MAEVKKRFKSREKYLAFKKKLDKKGIDYTFYANTVITEEFFVTYDDGKGEEDDSLSGNDTEQSKDKEE